MRATIGRWGKSLAVRLPAELSVESGLSEGQKVDIVSLDGAVVIRPARGPIDVEALFAGKSREEWRALYAGSYDWGADLGREAIEE